MFENLNGCEGYLNFRWRVVLLMSSAKMNPSVVTTRAVSFR